MRTEICFEQGAGSFQRPPSFVRGSSGLEESVAVDDTLLAADRPALQFDEGLKGFDGPSVFESCVVTCGETIRMIEVVVA